jgi:CBS domain-containing protein
MTKYVKDIMTRKVLSIDEDATILEALKKMHDCNVSSLLVSCGGDRPFGIVSRKDIIRELVVNEGDIKQPVSKIMSSPLILATPNLRIKDATTLMERFHIRRLPVIEKGAIVGIISTSDVFRYVSNKFLGSGAPKPAAVAKRKSGKQRKPKR